MKFLKPIITILIISLFSSTSLFAQLDISKGLLISDDQRFIRQALDSSLVIVRQDYVLKSTTGLDSTEWGRSGNPWFGRGYSLGIIAGDYIWANIRSKTPWANDPNLKKYEKADTLKPSLSNAGFRHFYSQNYSDAVNTNTDSLLAVYKPLQQVLGLKFGNNHGEQQGWIVLAYSSKPLNINDTSKIELSIFKTTAIFNDSTREALLNKVPEKDNIIGGIFVTTRITTGNIQVLISGILLKKPLNWYIQAIEPPKEIVPESENQLTPIPADKTPKKE